MAIQRIEYTSDKKPPSFLIHILFWGFCFFALSWHFFGDRVVAGMISVLGIFPAAFSVKFAHHQKYKSRFKLVRTCFSSQGYKPDFELKPVLLIDSQARKLAYFSNAGNWYELMDFGDIRGWEHAWINHTEDTPNAWGDRVTSRTTHKKNVLILNTNNPHQPLYKIHLRGYAQGELWMARLSALIKG